MPRSAPPTPIAERVARLRYTPLFADIPAPQLRGLAERCRTVDVEAGEVVVRQGDEDDSLYVVVGGVLRVLRVDAAGHEDVLGELHKGEFFGEIALLEAEARTASVVARSRARLMALDRRDFQAVADRNPRVEEAIREHIRHRRHQHVDRTRPEREVVLQRLSALLEGLSETLLEDLGREVDWLWVEGGTEVVREGSRGDSMYLVSRGHLVAWVSDGSGGEIRVGEIGPGEVLGEASLLSDAPRNATVRAVGDCELLCLSRRGLHALLGHHPDLQPRFQRMVRRRRDVRAERLATAGVDAPVRFPTASEVEEVILETDPVACNDGITRLYYRIGTGLAEMLGRENVNWPLYGARASLTAGSPIRKEVLTPGAGGAGMVVVRFVARTMERFFAGSSLNRRFDATLETVSTAIAAGNLRIFAEIGSVVGRFLRTFAEDDTFDERKLNAFLDTLVPGPVELGGQDLLAEGLTCWYRARFEDDPDRKAELILLGNCNMGLHEQTRVQPDIEEALEAPLRLTVGDELGRWVSEAPILRHMPWHARLRSAADRFEDALLRRAARSLRRAITRFFMRFQLPEGDIRLGRAVRSALSTPLSDELATIELPELRDFLERQGGIRDRGASDWSSLEDRMHYIVALFRRTQKDRRLFRPPFDDMG